ncbi:hypothetical protein Isop_0248 [Isosphaera pallida ATCC 43644]|uniref:DUF4864 domain-containing protein n=1 Tax=Isosphaera pallida (strain ATCC 43644 / DSM 9630 / IS1B) TaxID=575540 RepID=E8QWF8_ISOPI|nr:DUF4864 domain-containing protein [Isosphaera pallida]ADV60845.1 hypothetical protein Isop_0248 [Isosphaera pallida ATCC 43644]
MAANHSSESPTLRVSGPDPSLSPRDVVAIQLDALRHNDQPYHDAGIETVFRFASEGNQRSTGPLRRFAGLVRNPLYAPLLYHRRADLGETYTLGDEVAWMNVRVIDDNEQSHIYEFMLSRDPNTSCWRTDSVLPTLPDGFEFKAES